MRVIRLCSWRSQVLAWRTWNIVDGGLTGEDKAAGSQICLQFMTDDSSYFPFLNPVSFCPASSQLHCLLLRGFSTKQSFQSEVIMLNRCCYWPGQRPSKAELRLLANRTVDSGWCHWLPKPIQFWFTRFWWGYRLNSVWIQGCLTLEHSGGSPCRVQPLLHVLPVSLSYCLVLS